MTRNDKDPGKTNSNPGKGSTIGAQNFLNVEPYFFVTIALRSPENVNPENPPFTLDVIRSENDS